MTPSRHPISSWVFIYFYILTIPTFSSSFSTITSTHLSPRKTHTNCIVNVGRYHYHSLTTTKPSLLSPFQNNNARSFDRSKIFDSSTTTPKSKVTTLHLFNWFGKDKQQENQTNNRDTPTAVSKDKNDTVPTGTSPKSKSSSPPSSTPNPSSSSSSTSMMGSTASTMENFKQSQELGKRTSLLLNELSSITVEGTAAKGKIKVIYDGQQRPLNVEIDEEFSKVVGIDELNEAITAAMQDAYVKSMNLMQDKMQALYVDLGLPVNKS